MPLGPFALQWRTPSPNPPIPKTPLPPSITRSYISTPSGPLELLSAIPEKPLSLHQQPLFFAHGGFGCAEMWIEYMLYFSARGYPCYAVSLRGHGKSWYPGFFRMWVTSRGEVAGDLVGAVRFVEVAERARRGVKSVEDGDGKEMLVGGGEGGEDEDEDVRVILIAHSAGGALSQYVLSRGLVKVWGLCMFAAVPGFGSFSVYKHWAPIAPFHFPYRLFHPRYLLATPSQIHTAFFTPSTPRSLVQNFAALLSPYESMLWPLQSLFRFVSGPDVISSIVGWRLRSPNGPNGSGTSTFIVTDRLLVLAAEHDVLCTPVILRDAAKRYRDAFRRMFWEGRLEGLGGVRRLRMKGERVGEQEGVSFRVVQGVGHHLQNCVEWERGAREILEWVGRI